MLLFISINLKPLKPAIQLPNKDGTFYVFQAATNVPPNRNESSPGKSMGWFHQRLVWWFQRLVLTHPSLEYHFFDIFPICKSEAQKNPMVSCSTKQYDSNPTSFRANFLEKQLIYIISSNFQTKTFCGFCVSKTLPIFLPPVSSTKTEDQIEVCESSSQLIRAGLIQCHGDTLTTLPSCNDFRVFQGSLLGHGAEKKDKTKGTWKQSHCFKMNLILYIWQYFCRNTPVNMNLLILKRSGLDLIMLWL